MHSGSIDSTRYHKTDRLPSQSTLLRRPAPTQLTKAGGAVHTAGQDHPSTPPDGLTSIVQVLSRKLARARGPAGLQRRQAYAQSKNKHSGTGSSSSLSEQSSQYASSTLVSLYGESDSDSEESLVDLTVSTQGVGARSPARIKNDAPVQTATGSGSAKATELLAWSLGILGRVGGGANASLFSDFPYVGAIGLPVVFAMSYLDQQNAKNDKKLSAANYEEALQQIEALDTPLKRAMASLAAEDSSDEEREVALATTVVAMELLRMLNSILDTYETAYLPPHEKNLRKACRALQTERLQKQIERAQLPADAQERRRALDEQIAALGQRIDELKPRARQDLKALLKEHLAQFDALRERILHVELGVEGTLQDEKELPRLRAQLDALKADIDVLQGFVDGTRLKLLDFTDAMGNAEIKLFRDSKLFWARTALDMLATGVGAAASATGLLSVVASSTALSLLTALVNAFLAGLDRAEATREMQAADASAALIQGKLLKVASCLQSNQQLPPEQQKILNIVLRNIMDSRLGDLRWTKKHTKAQAMRRFLKGLAVQLLGSPKQIAFVIAGLTLLASNPGTAVPLLVTAGALSAVFGALFLAFAAAEQLAKKQRKDRHKRRLDVSRRFVSLHGGSGITRFYTGSDAERERMARELRLGVPKKLRKHCSVEALLSNQPLSNLWLMDQLHQEGVNPPAKGSPPSLAAQICSGAGLAAGTLGYLKQVAQEQQPEAAREEMQAVLAEELFGFKHYDASRLLDTRAPLLPAATQERLDSVLLAAVQTTKYQALTTVLTAPVSEPERQWQLLNSPQARTELLALRHELMTTGQPPIDQQDLEGLVKANAANEVHSMLMLGSGVVSPEAMDGLVRALSVPELYQDTGLVQASQSLSKAAAPRVPPTQLMKAVKEAGRRDQRKHNPLARLAHVIGIPTRNPLGSSSRACRALKDSSDAQKAKLIEAVLLEYKKLLPVDNVTGQPLVPQGKSEREHLMELLQETAEQARVFRAEVDAGAEDEERLVGKQDYRALLAKRQGDLAALAEECVTHLKNKGAIPALPPAKHGPFAGLPPVVFASAVGSTAAAAA